MARKMPLESDVWRAVVAYSDSTGTVRTMVYGPYSRRAAAIRALSDARTAGERWAYQGWGLRLTEARLERASGWEEADE